MRSLSCAAYFPAQVLGNAKGVIAVVISVLVFQNPMTWIGSAGYLVTVIGCFCYGLAKRKAAQQAQVEKDDPPPKSGSSPSGPGLLA